MPKPTPISTPSWERVNLSLPRGLKHLVGRMAKKRYQHTKASTLSGLAAVLLKRELTAKHRLSYRDIVGL